MLRVVYASESLKQAASEVRHDRTYEVLAKRMGVTVDDPRTRLVDVVFSAAVLDACGHVSADADADADAAQPVPMIVVNRMNEALARVAVLAQGLSTRRTTTTPDTATPDTATPDPATPDPAAVTRPPMAGTPRPGDCGSARRFGPGRR